MSKTMYLECNSGISGDMTVAALLDLGADEKQLMQALDSLPLEGFSVEINRVEKAGVFACDFSVLLDEEYENHDHDMEYLHGAQHGDDGEYEHHHSHHHGVGHGSDNDEYEHHHSHHHGVGHGSDSGEYGHHHSHHHGVGHGSDSGEYEHHHSHHHGVGHGSDSGEYEHHHSHHHGRNMADIIHILEHAELTERARRTATDIFRVLAEAEAQAHGKTVETVHFHEVGAVDSIVDIVACAVCLDNLDVEQIIVPKLCEGSGTVRCQHGILSIPVPAVTNIVAKYQIPLSILPVEGEFVTPTGAAIVAAIRTRDKLPAEFTVLKVGVGAGKRSYERPSLLRAMLIEETDEGKTDESQTEGGEGQIYKLECNIDDCTGEAMGYAMERLFSAGARDVHYIPVFMKKNRPAYQLNVICEKRDVQRLEEIIFRETTTIGIRRFPVERTTLDRRMLDMETSLGTVTVKECSYKGEIRRYPEYESVAKLAREQGISYQQAYTRILKEI